MAMIHVTEVKVVGPHSLGLTFSDGTRKRVNLRSELYGEVFESLRNPAEFARAALEGWTVSWPNGADFAPDFLYELEPEGEPVS
jgi:hypothetical protein